MTTQSNVLQIMISGAPARLQAPRDLLVRASRTGEVALVVRVTNDTSSGQQLEIRSREGGLTGCLSVTVLPGATSELTLTGPSDLGARFQLYLELTFDGHEQEVCLEIAPEVAHIRSVQLKSVAWAFVAFLVSALLYSVVAARHDAAVARLSEEGVSVTGRVQKLTPDDHHTFIYAYTVNGRSYRKTDRHMSEKVGDAIEVVYLPADPEVSARDSAESLREPNGLFVYAIPAMYGVLSLMRVVMVLVTGRRRAGWALRA
jgi:hypothetical protein